MLCTWVHQGRAVIVGHGALVTAVCNWLARAREAGKLGVLHIGLGGGEGGRGGDRPSLRALAEMDGLSTPAPVSPKPA